MNLPLLDWFFLFGLLSESNTGHSLYSNEMLLYNVIFPARRHSFRGAAVKVAKAEYTIEALQRRQTLAF